MTRAATWLLTAGALLLAGLVERDWLSGVGFGCLLMTLGGLLAAATGLRSWNLARKSSNSEQ